VNETIRAFFRCITTYYSHSPNKRRATIIFHRTLTAHILLNSGRRDVIQPAKDRTLCEEQDSRRYFDVNTLNRDVKINRRATLIRDKTSTQVKPAISYII